MPELQGSLAYGCQEKRGHQHGDDPRWEERMEVMTCLGCHLGPPLTSISPLALQPGSCFRILRSAGSAIDDRHRSVCLLRDSRWRPDDICQFALAAVAVG